MSNAARCDLIGKGDIFKLHALCHNPRFKCQKNYIYSTWISNGRIRIKKYKEKNFQKGPKKCGIISSNID